MARKQWDASDQMTTAPWEVGVRYFVRTVTMFVVGELAWVGRQELVFMDASWIPDTGRFADALRTGRFAEVEPFPDSVIIGRGSIVDATVWTHDLPRHQQ